MDYNNQEDPRPRLSWRSWAMLITGISIVLVVCICLATAIPYMHPFAGALATSVMLTIIIGIPAGALLAVGGTVLWLHTSSENKKIAARKFAANANNVYPAYLDLRNGRFVQATNGELPPVVPEHYAPHIVYTYKDSSRSELAAAEEQKLLPAPLPEPYTLSNVLRDWYPSEDGILLAKSAEPGLLTVPVGESLCHTSFTGRTDGGKTTKQRLLLVQLLFLQQMVYLCDKSFRRFRPDKRSGAFYDYRPIEKLLAVPPMTQTKDVVKLLKELTNELAERRNTNRYLIKKHKDIYAVFDELPAFAREDPSIMDYIGTLLRESRQYGIFVCGASQDLLNTTLKNDNGAVRENLLTNFYDGGDAATARLVLDLQRNDKLDETGLGTKGISYLCAKGIALPHTKVRTPLADNMATFTLLSEMTGLQPMTETDMMRSTDISTMVSTSYPNTSVGYDSGYDENRPGQHLDMTNGNSEIHAQNTKVLQVLEMDSQHKTQSEIIQEVWRAEPNTRAGREAVEELRLIRAHIAQQVQKGFLS